MRPRARSKQPPESLARAKGACVFFRGSWLQSREQVTQDALALLDGASGTLGTRPSTFLGRSAKAWVNGLQHGVIQAEPDKAFRRREIRDALFKGL